MALITPSNLQFILGLSLSSRALVFALQLISNIVIDDHRADAYRNRYHNLLTNDTSTLEIRDSHRLAYKAIQGFTKWDAQYFLEISNDGYVSEQHLAFLPLYPVAISAVRQLIFEHKRVSFGHFTSPDHVSLEQQKISTSQVERYIQSAFVGFVLNNFLFFPIASVCLFILTKLVRGQDDKYSKNVIWWFCFNPASVFFSSCYTESLFAMLSLASLALIEYKSDSYLINSEKGTKKLPKTTKTRGYQPLADLDRLLKVCLPPLALLALCTATRSNGLMTIGFIIYQFLLKYSSLIQADQTRWSILIYLSLILEILQDILVMIMSSIIAASGYITFQIYSYMQFCSHEYSQKKGSLQERPEWCSHLVPHPYRHVQAKYWNVGLLRYHEFKQIPNFLLAAPISYIVMKGSLEKARVVSRTASGKRQLVYYLQCIILTLFCGLSINVQVTTRLLASSCPAIYWICTDLSRESRSYSRLVVLYFASYFIVGAILHTNFYPWT